MEEAARVSGAGWTRTFFRIVIPLMMPTLVLLSAMNFAGAATTVSSIILLAERGTVTLSILALEAAGEGLGEWERASALSIILMVMALSMALVARKYGQQTSVRHTY